MARAVGQLSRLSFFLLKFTIDVDGREYLRGVKKRGDQLLMARRLFSRISTVRATRYLKTSQ